MKYNQSQLAIYTYRVPAMAVVKWVCSSGQSFASPKSEILASRLASRRMLLALMSLWMMRGAISSCRYARPRAVPTAMLKRVGQSIWINCSRVPAITNHVLKWMIEAQEWETTHTQKWNLHWCRKRFQTEASIEWVCYLANFREDFCSANTRKRAACAALEHNNRAVLRGFYAALCW